MLTYQIEDLNEIDWRSAKHHLTSRAFFVAVVYCLLRKWHYIQDLHSSAP